MKLAELSANVTEADTRWCQLAGSMRTEANLKQLFLNRQNSPGSSDARLRIARAWPVKNEAMLKRFVSSGGFTETPNHGALVALGQDEHDTLLFHGTKETCVPNIEAEGLSVQSARATGMLGKGIYGAPDPRKSQQYVDNRQGPFFMLLCRFNLQGAQHAGKATPHRNSVYDEYCVLSDERVVVLWAMKVERDPDANA